MNHLENFSFNNEILNRYYDELSEINQQIRDANFFRKMALKKHRKNLKKIMSEIRAEKNRSGFKFISSQL